MIYAVLPLTSSHVTGAHFNKKYVVLVIPRKSEHCLAKPTVFLKKCCALPRNLEHVRLEKCFFCFLRGNSMSVGIKSHAFMVKSGGNWPNHGVLLSEMGGQ